MNEIPKGKCRYVQPNYSANVKNRVQVTRMSPSVFCVQSISFSYAGEVNQCCEMILKYLAHNRIGVLHWAWV